MDSLYQLASGPGMYLTVVLFLGGLAVQIWRFRHETLPRELRRLPTRPPQAPRKSDAAETPQRRPGFWGLVDIVERSAQPLDRLQRWLSRSAAGVHPLMIVLTAVFHVLLFVTPIFLVAHNTLLRSAFGFGLPSLPEALSDLLTFVVLICVLSFLYRRLFLRRVRAITSAYDLFVLLITGLPFVTGFACYHQMGPYMPLLLLHVVSGELMLILVPFTRLGHAVFFFFYRFLMDSEYSFRQGSRAWSTGPRGA
jgi:nitrate reductase gamma subunit